MPKYYGTLTITLSGWFEADGIEELLGHPMECASDCIIKTEIINIEEEKMKKNSLRRKNNKVVDTSTQKEDKRMNINDKKVQAFEIIKKKQVDVYILLRFFKAYCIDSARSEYNRYVYGEHLTHEECVLLKEVLYDK